METLIYLDTHIVAWLFLGRLDRLPSTAQDAIESHDLLISPIVLVELQYLFEIKRVDSPARQVFDSLERTLGLKICDLPFLQIAQQALDQDWTRDPFDRFIVAQASLRRVPLITKDRAIHENYDRVLWHSAAPDA